MGRWVNVKMGSTPKTIIEFIIGIAMLPTAGGFVVYVMNDPNLSGILGFTLLMSLAIVVLALGIIYKAYKEAFGK